MVNVEITTKSRILNREECSNILGQCCIGSFKSYGMHGQIRGSVSELMRVGELGNELKY